MKSPCFKLSSTVLFLVLSVASPAYAAENSEHGHQHETSNTSDDRIQHGSHEHGNARLTLAKTDTGMEIMLESPAVNLFGFEHQAHAKEEQEVVQAVQEKLKAGDALFIANQAADCKLENVDIESDRFSSHEEKKAQAEETHSDVDIIWLFRCEKPLELASVEIKLFSQFPEGFRHLNVEWITDHDAGTAKLEADDIVKLGQ